MLPLVKKAGIKAEKLFVDPGFGQGNYGKNTAENFYILAHLEKLKATGCEILSGWSRKSMIGDVTGREIKDRLYGSLAAALFSMLHGAKIIRVHDVAATKDVVNMYDAYMEALGA